MSHVAAFGHGLPQPAALPPAAGDPPPADERAVPGVAREQFGGLEPAGLAAAVYALAARDVHTATTDAELDREIATTPGQE